MLFFPDYPPSTLRALFIGVCLFAVAPACIADDTANSVFALRNHNPFLQIFGLPTFQTATLAEVDEADYTVSLELANNADFGDTDTENFLIDGESYFVTLSTRRRIKSWLELGADVPLVVHDGGFMDSGIKSWHDIFSMSNTKRRGIDNQLQYLYQANGSTLYELSSSTSGIGDIQLTAAVPFRGQIKDGYALALRASLKLPTGDDKKLTGSGGADFATALYMSDARMLLGRPLGISGFAGALFLGEGDVLPALQRDVLPFGGVSASWWFAQRFSLTVQMQMQGAYFDSDIEELGGSTAQLDVGLTYRPAGRRSCWKFAVVEDIQADATTDFALHFSVDTRCGVVAD